MPRRTSRGQTGLAANFRQTAPEIHASLVGPLSVAASARFFMEFRGRNAHPNRPGGLSHLRQAEEAEIAEEECRGHIYASNLGSRAFKNLTRVSRTMAPVSRTSS
jgi:hypothetical protein